MSDGVTKIFEKPAVFGSALVLGLLVVSFTWHLPAHRSILIDELADAGGFTVVVATALAAEAAANRLGIPERAGLALIKAGLALTFVFGAINSAHAPSFGLQMASFYFFFDGVIQRFLRLLR